MSRKEHLFNYYGMMAMLCVIAGLSCESAGPAMVFLGLSFFWLIFAAVVRIWGPADD